jgi:hypothetical protein
MSRHLDNAGHGKARIPRGPSGMSGAVSSRRESGNCSLQARLEAGAARGGGVGCIYVVGGTEDRGT